MVNFTSSRRGFLAGAGAFAALGLAACSNNGDQAAQDNADSNGSDEKVTADAVETKQVFVTPQWVQSVIDGNQPESADYKILEVSWGEESDSATYTKGHIPGAVHLNTDLVEEPEKWNFRTAPEFAELFKDFGITDKTCVIVYGKDANDSADDRAALGFLWCGVENVKCLDGGMAKWTEAGYKTDTESVKPEATDKDFGVDIPAHPEYILSLDQVKDKLANDSKFKLVSIRSYDEYTGKTSGYSYIDRAGEPKGAIWGHDTDDGSYTTDDGTTVSLDVLSQYLADYDASTDDELCFYCGTGWRAAIPFLICYQNNLTNMSVFDGGWNEWQMNPDLEVQIGDPKTGDVTYTTVAELATDKAKAN